MGEIYSGGKSLLSILRGSVFVSQHPDVSWLVPLGDLDGTNRVCEASARAPAGDNDDVAAGVNNSPFPAVVNTVRDAVVHVLRPVVQFLLWNKINI